MQLAKCCHDVDLIVYWMGENKRCVQVSSFGSRGHFRSEQAPANSGTHCVNCAVESTCPYSAKKIYSQRSGQWPMRVVFDAERGNVCEDIEDGGAPVPIDEQQRIVDKCLAHPDTRYGRCVYKSPNDVMDNQIVMFQFDDGSTATLTMVATSKDLCTRKTRIYGSLGELEWDDSTSSTTIQHYDFLTKKSKTVDCTDAMQVSEEDAAGPRVMSAHGGSDYFLMRSFIEAVRQGDKRLVCTDMEDSFRSHLLVFAAEHSRRTASVVNIDEFKRQNNIED